MTKDKTLVRRGEVLKGSGTVITGLDTMAYAEWKVFPKNTFNVLQSHDCECDPNYTSTVNIEDIPFSIYPNPVNGSLINISATQAIQSVEVVNVLGQNLMQQSFGGNDFVVQIATNKLPNGIHLVKVNFGNNRYSLRKLIIE